MRPFLFVLAALIPAVSQAQTCDDRGQDFEARIALCDQAFEAADSKDAAAHALSLKGEAQRMLGQFDEAAATLQQALGFTPENAWVWVELGNVRYDQGDTAGALAHYSAALAVEDYIDAWANRAESWWQFNAGQRCSDDADNALRLDPQYAYANEIKGRCLIDLGQAEAGAVLFRHRDLAGPRLPERLPQQAGRAGRPWPLRGCGRRRRRGAAPRHGRRPEPRDRGGHPCPPPAGAWRICPPRHRRDRGRGAAERYPQNLAAVNVQGAALLADGKAEEADRVTQVLRQNPDGARMEATYHDTLARIDAALGRMEDAYMKFEAALDLDANLSKTYARKLSELGFLPLSNAPSGVLTALRRCIDVKKTACVITK
jgi:tetratricopeptide (TPR) repeat protein